MDQIVVNRNEVKLEHEKIAQAKKHIKLQKMQKIFSKTYENMTCILTQNILNKQEEMISYTIFQPIRWKHS